MVPNHDVERGGNAKGKPLACLRPKVRSRVSHIEPISVLKSSDIDYNAKELHSSCLSWFTGSGNVCEDKKATFFYRNGLMTKVMPIAALAASVAIFAGLARKNQWLPPWMLSSIKHPYAAQVFGIFVG